MALSKLALGTALLLTEGVLGKALTFPIYDSTDRPTEFKDGLLTYVKITKDFDIAQPLEQFLLCTTCTISYMFGKPDDFATIVATETMTFEYGLSPVTVKFVDVNLQLQADDDAQTVYEWNMDIGYIDPSFQSTMYFTNFKENMLGLAPMATTDAALLKRQFLWQFTQTAPQSTIVTTNESFAFNGGSQFAVGGSAVDYEALVCENGNKDAGVGLTNKHTIQQNVMPVATSSMNFVPQTFYQGLDPMLKIQNYVPPMKEELLEQVLFINTWNRETLLPSFFYNYFMETFMIPAYTCDKLEAKDLAYPGMSSTYSCYCNNGDYHTMPQINLEISGQNFQYDIDPAGYMFLPYLNYTVPMSLCILGIQETPSTLPDGKDYVSLGQRAMASFPFYAVYDRAANTVTLELGNATELGGKSALGVQVAISITIVLVLFIMLVYLIVLRRNRIKAEEWLEQHKGTLFSHAANLKTEEEILEALVKSKELKDLLENRNAPTTPNVRNVAGLERLDARLVEEDSNNGSQKSSSTLKGARLPVKTFKNEEE